VASRPGRVLIAEGDAVRRGQLCQTLTAAGYAVTEVSTGAMAIAAFAADPPPVVLLNTELDGDRGVETCRRIRALDEALASYILVYASQDVLRPVLDALDAGADDYVLHPDNPDILRTRLAIAGRRLAREDVRRAAEADAARARYLAGVGEMAIALQHEINNPLAAILAHAELMAMDAADAGAMDESLTTILEQARRIATVVRKLSSLRNPTSVEYVPGKRMVHLHEDG
jgi:two-component system C4-dicarboxylate transport response regulator DctD